MSRTTLIVSIVTALVVICGVGFLGLLVLAGSAADSPSDTVAAERTPRSKDGAAKGAATPTPKQTAASATATTQPTTAPTPAPPPSTPTTVPPTPTAAPPTPTAVPPTATPTPDLPRPTAEERAYLIENAGLARDFSTGLGEIGDKFADFSPSDVEDDVWKEEFADSLELLQTTRDGMLALEPPPSLQAVQDNWAEAAVRLGNAADLLKPRIEDLDAEIIGEAGDLIGEAVPFMSEAARLLVEYNENHS